VKEVTQQLDDCSLNTKIMIDFSHANSSKKFENQMLVSTDVSNQISQGNQNLFGVMVESHLIEGNQKLIDGKAEVYGQSITDACIGWNDTETLLAQLSEAVLTRRNK
jgi:3-deoxy-7-phosphoheptulonate synthase